MSTSPEYDEDPRTAPRLRIGGWLPEPRTLDGPPAVLPAHDGRARSTQRVAAARPPVAGATRRRPRRPHQPVVLTSVAVAVLATLIVWLLPNSTPDAPVDPPVAASAATEGTVAADLTPEPVASLSPARVSLSSRATMPTGGPSATRGPAPTRRSDAAPPTTARPPSPSPSTRTSPGELTPLPPSAERDLRSTGGGQETHIDFVNARAERVTVYWLDYGGNRRQYAVLQPGQRHRQHTYVGHPWVVTTAGGRALVCFLPAASIGTAVIR